MIFLQAGAALFFLEIATFIGMCTIIGFFPAMGLCIISAVAGFIIVQHQGLGTLRQVQSSLDKGLMPMDELFDGICIFAAGMLLIAPGFLSDIIGFGLLIPVLRRKLRVLIAKRYGKQDGSFNPDTGVIDGEFVRVREDVTFLKSPPQSPLQ